MGNNGRSGAGVVRLFRPWEVHLDVLAVGGHGIAATLRQGGNRLGFGAQALRGDRCRLVAHVR